jgi:hypothetical protein
MLAAAMLRLAVALTAAMLMLPAAMLRLAADLAAAMLMPAVVHAA